MDVALPSLPEGFQLVGSEPQSARAEPDAAGLPPLPDGFVLADGAEEKQQTVVPAAPPSQSSSTAQRLTTGFLNQGAAAGQRTTPNIGAHAKNMLSDTVHENDQGELLYRDQTTGQLVPTDKNKHVVLRDPADNRVKVFARSAGTDEGVLSSLGRVAMTGMGSNAPTKMASAPVVNEVASAATRLSETGAPVTVPKAVATDNMAVQRVAATARNVPVAGNPLVKSAERTISQLGDKADEIAGGLGTGEVVPAGDTAKSAITNWITGTSAQKAQQLYDKVDNMVFSNVTTDLDATRKIIADIAASRTSAALPMGKAINTVLEGVQRPGGLTYDGIKQLRTHVGEQLKTGILPEGMSAKELNRIYGGLSEDLGSAVSNAGGPQAAAAFDRANKYYRLVSERRDALAKIVGKDGNAPAEQVFDRLTALAGSTSRADISKLAQARKVMAPDEWNEVASAVIAKMGRDVEGTFSPLRFVTGYGKLSEEGKNLLFRSPGQGTLRQSLDDIAKVSSKFNQLQKFSNPSGTAQGGIGAALGAGMWADPMSTLASGLTAWGVAKALSSPATAGAVSHWSRSYYAVASKPTQSSLAAFNSSTRALADRLGVSVGDILRGIQGPVPSRAEENQQ